MEATPNHCSVAVALFRMLHSAFCLDRAVRVYLSRNACRPGAVSGRFVPRTRFTPASHQALIGATNVLANMTFSRTLFADIHILLWFGRGIRGQVAASELNAGQIMPAAPPLSMRRK